MSIAKDATEKGSPPRAARYTSTCSPRISSPMDRSPDRVVQFDDLAGADLTEPFDPRMWSWSELARAFRPVVYRRARRLTHDAEDAQDLTQDVFLRVFRYLPSFEPGGSFVGWLNRITLNVYLDQLRRKRRMSFHPVPGDVLELMTPPTAGPAQILDEQAFDPDIQRALALLRPEFLAPVLLCDIYGLRYDQIAAVLDIKVATAGTRIHRGRAQLREALAHRALHRR